MWADGLIPGTSVWLIVAVLRSALASMATLVLRRPPPRRRSAYFEPAGASLVGGLLVGAGVIATMWFIRDQATPTYRTLFDAALELFGLGAVASESLDARTPGRVLLGVVLTTMLLALLSVAIARLLHSEPIYPASHK